MPLETTEPPTPSIEYPGIIGRFTQSGFDNIMKNVVPKLGQEIGDMELPDYAGTFRRAFGKVSYNVSSMNLINFVAPLAELTSVPGRGVNLTLSDARAVINGSWEYSYKAFFFKVGDNGTFEVNGTGMGLSLEILFDTDESGYPNMTIGECVATLDDVDVQMSGGASWLYNLFSRRLSSSIKRDVNVEVCNEIRDYVGSLANKLHALKLSSPVLGGMANIDFKMVQPPVFTPDYVDIFVTGNIRAMNATDGEGELKAQWMNRTDVSSKMMYIWISDYVFNTMGQFLYDSETMQYSLHPLNIDDIPKESDFHTLLPLEIYALRKSFPEDVSGRSHPSAYPFQEKADEGDTSYSISIDLTHLYSQFNDRLIQLSFRLAAPPTFETTVAGQLMTLSSEVSVRAVDLDETGDTVATIQVALQLLVTPTLDAEHLSGFAKLQSYHIELESSTFETNREQKEILEKALLVLIEDAGLPWMNGLLGHGIQFPVISQNWRFNNSQVTTHEGYMLVETDFGGVVST
ncbi:lipopolysaccharide-binding protein-like [Glandiceps talaboti]